MEKLVKKGIVRIAVLTSILFVSFFGFLHSCSDEQKELGTVENTSVLSRYGGNYVIGIDRENGVYEITADKNELLKVFAELALEQNLGEIIFTSLEIKKEIIVGSNPTDYYYGLFASDATGKYNSAIELNKNGFSFSAKPNGGSITCSSTNCQTGCTPYQQSTLYGDKVWTCSSCASGCKKTMTVIIKAFD